MLVVRRGGVSDARGVGKTSLVVVFPVMVEVVEYGAQPSGLGRLLQDGRHVVSRNVHSPGGTERPHAFVPAAVSATVGADRDDASVLDCGSPVEIVVVGNQRIVFGMDDEKRDLDLAELQARRVSIVRASTIEKSDIFFFSADFFAVAVERSPRRSRRKDGVVLFFGVEWRKICGLRKGCYVPVVHDVGVFDLGELDNAKVPVFGAYSRIVVDVPSNASPHAPLKDLSVRSILGVFDKIVSSAKVHASGEGDGGDHWTVGSGGRQVLYENVGRRGMCDDK